MYTFKWLLFFGIFSAAHLLQAQSDSAAVHQVVIDLFDGMRAGDSSKVHAVFDNEVRMFSSFSKKSGEEILHEGDLDKFLESVGTPHEQVWDERIRNTVIQIDGNIAQVWTEYDFYLGDTFSHCGIDAFHLVRRKGKWKVIHLMDTRRAKGCSGSEK